MKIAIVHVLLLSMALPSVALLPVLKGKSSRFTSMLQASGLEASSIVKQPVFAFVDDNLGLPLAVKNHILDIDHQANKRKKWGVDVEDEYWFDSRIHKFGNTGFWGAIHAAISPIATKIIDIKAYDGVDIRKKVRRTSEIRCELHM
jgi:hypothetical protein